MAPSRLLSCLAIAGAAAALSLPVAAQTTTGTASSARTGGPMGWLPGAGTGTGYVGLNVGRSRFHADCGARDFLENVGFDCGLRDNMYHLYAGSGMGGLGGMGGFGGMLGAEIGYVDMGRISRGGGDTRARGLNLSVVARAPIAAGFGNYGKLGTTYGWTRTNSVAESGLDSGKRDGFGLAYGFGATYDFTENVSAVVAWDRHNFRFAGSGRDAIRTTSIGLQYRY